MPFGDKSDHYYTSHRCWICRKDLEFCFCWGQSLFGSDVGGKLRLHTYGKGSMEPPGHFYEVIEVCGFIDTFDIGFDIAYN